ncbi:MAG: c-type cytochrome [Chloroflexi bacterium]|nr:c-type cytochrome [Chloroflexota bacterium]
MKWLLITLSVIVALIIIGGASQIIAGSAPVPTMAGTNCISQGCHEQQNGNANIYVGLNGRNVTSEPELSVNAGDTFEIDFHFTGMLGQASQHKGVGALIAMPEQAQWKVSAGTDSHPAAWSEKGTGESFWSPAWDQAANGSNGTGAKWVACSDQPTAYYLDFSASPWAVQPHQSVAADGGPGDPADLDGVADHMGADALVEVPFEAPAGIYKIMVSGIGNGIDGRPARVSKTISVEVHAAVTPTPPPAEVPSGQQLYSQNCSGCHGKIPLQQIAKTAPADAVKAMTEGTGSMPAFDQAKGGQLTARQIADIAGYLKAEAIAGPPPAAPPIAHFVKGRTDCLACHSQEAGMVPVPANHSSDNSQCQACHKAPPPMPHAPQGNAACTSCHSTNGPLQLAASHAGRKDDSCYKCHEGAPKPSSDASATPGATAAKPPAIPHALEGRQDCLSCHAPGGMISVPDSHSTYKNNMCTGCHVR